MPQKQKPAPTLWDDTVAANKNHTTNWDVLKKNISNGTPTLWEQMHGAKMPSDPGPNVSDSPKTPAPPKGWDTKAGPKTSNVPVRTGSTVHGGKDLISTSSMKGRALVSDQAANLAAKREFRAGCNCEHGDWCDCK